MTEQEQIVELTNRLNVLTKVLYAILTEYGHPIKVDNDPMMRLGIEIPDFILRQVEGQAAVSITFCTNIIDHVRLFYGSGVRITCVT
jgi:hypothetical protein